MVFITTMITEKRARERAFERKMNNKLRAMLVRHTDSHEQRLAASMKGLPRPIMRGLIAQDEDMRHHHKRAHDQWNTVEASKDRLLRQSHLAMRQRGHLGDDVSLGFSNRGVYLGNTHYPTDELEPSRVMSKHYREALEALICNERKPEVFPEDRPPHRIPPKGASVPIHL